MELMLITNSPAVASFAENSGVSRIFLDLERIGKLKRQGHLDTLISKHSLKDIPVLKKVLNSSKLLVRINPINKNTEDEIEKVIENGADIIMLPMFRRANELSYLISLIGGRAKFIPLIETYDAYCELDKILNLDGVDEIYIGLNDLHIDMNLKFIFEPIANGMVDEAVKKIKSANLPFGFGGIARIGEGVIPGELILAEHARLGSNSVILSRSFHKSDSEESFFKSNNNLKKETAKLFKKYNSLLKRTNSEVENDRLALIEKISEVTKTAL